MSWSIQKKEPRKGKSYADDYETTHTRVDVCPLHAAIQLESREDNARVSPCDKNVIIGLRGHGALKTLFESNRSSRAIVSRGPKRKERSNQNSPDIVEPADYALNVNDRCVHLLFSFQSLPRDVYANISKMRKKKNKRGKEKGNILISIRNRGNKVSLAPRARDSRRWNRQKAKTKRFIRGADDEIKLCRDSCNFQYRLKSIRLAFRILYRKARGYTWPAWSARAIHPSRSSGWRTADRWIPGRLLPTTLASTTSP